MGNSLKSPIMLLFCLISTIILSAAPVSSQCIADEDFVQDNDEREKRIAVAEEGNYNVRRVEFVGNLTTRDETIRRRILLHEGDIFTRYNLEQSLERLGEFKSFLGPLTIKDVSIKLRQDRRIVDIAFFFFEKKNLKELHLLLGKDLYAAAMYSSLREMRKEWGNYASDNFSFALLIPRKGLSSKVPESFDNFSVVQPTPEELEARFVSSGERQRVFEMFPFAKVGSSIRIHITLSYYSKVNDVISLSLSDWSNVYFSFDSERKGLVVDQVCLGGV